MMGDKAHEIEARILQAIDKYCTRHQGTEIAEVLGGPTYAFVAVVAQKSPTAKQREDAISALEGLIPVMRTDAEDRAAFYEKGTGPLQ